MLPRTDLLGRTLDGRYSIQRLIGQGGMGAVYEARHVGTGRRVALKIILDASAQQEEHLARFQREARAVGAVESDYIAQVFDTGRDAETGAPYIAMEYLEGEDVQSLLDRLGPLPVDLALRVILQGCLGLEAAHAAGVIHRDIKPANLFLSRKPDGQRIVKLLDFGVAKITTGDDHALTKAGTVMGSPLYMSPEQARGAGGVDARSDLWSLGIALYHAISGKRPNESAQGLGELLIAICSTPAPSLQTVAPWTPAAVAQIVAKVLTIEPSGRYQNATELARALKDLLPQGHGISDAMLVPLGDAERSSVAPPAQLASSGGAAQPVLASSGPAAQGQLGSSALVPPPTTLGTTGAEARPATPARRPLAAIVGALAAAALLGGGLLYMKLGGATALRAGAPVTAEATAPPSPPPPTPPPLPAAPPAPAPTVAPAVSASASASASAAVPAVSPSPSHAAAKHPAGAATTAPHATPAPATKKGADDDETSRK